MCVRACGLARMRVRACARVLLPVCEYGCACVCVRVHMCGFVTWQRRQTTNPASRTYMSQSSIKSPLRMAVREKTLDMLGLRAEDLQLFSYGC